MSEPPTQAPLTNMRSLPEDSDDTRPLTKPPESQGSDPTPQKKSLSPSPAPSSGTPTGERKKTLREVADAAMAANMTRKSIIKQPRITHKRWWLLWVALFQFFISTADLWLNSSFVYECSSRKIPDTLITTSFGIYYAILGSIDMSSGFLIQALGRRLKGTRFEGQQRACVQFFFYFLNVAGVAQLTWVEHNIAFPILHGFTGFGPQLAIMQTYTLDAVDNDWEFRKLATKAILFGRIVGTLVALACGTLVYETFGWRILVFFCLGVQTLVLIFIATAPTRKVMWRIPAGTQIGAFLKSLPHLLWCICAVTFTTGYFFGTINAVQTLYFKDTFNITATYTGLLLACAALVSIIAMGLYPVSVKPTWMSVGANCLLAASSIVFPFSVHIAMATVFLSISYACSAYLAAASQMMVDTITQPDVSVRVSGWNIACYSFGTAVAGFVAGIMYERWVWLPFVVSSGLIVIVIGPFIYLIIKYYEHLKHEMATMAIVIYVAAKWRHKALAHRQQRLKEQHDLEMKQQAEGAAATSPSSPTSKSGTQKRPLSSILKSTMRSSKQKGAEEDPSLEMPLQDVGPSNPPAPSERTESSSAGFDPSQSLSGSTSFGGLGSATTGSSDIATSRSMMIKHEPDPGLKPRSKSVDPGIFLRDERLSTRAHLQVDEPDELDHHRFIHPEGSTDDMDIDLEDVEHHRGMAQRKPHYHSDVVQAVHMNDHLGIGLFMRLKSLEKNHYYNNMVKHQKQKHPGKK